MCTELILASIYFLTIFVVNYFLFRLVKISVNNLTYLSKIKQLGKLIQNLPGIEKKQSLPRSAVRVENNFSTFLCYFFILIKKDLKKITFLPSLSKVKKTQDLLILGNTYHFLLKYTQESMQEKNTLFSNSSLNPYYFRLLENQYLTSVESKN